MSARFQLEKLSVSYGRTPILREIDLELQAGEFCALLGRNGSGKSTLLHAACGFLPLQGTVRVDGEDCTRQNERQRARRIALIPQQSGVTGGRSAESVVQMGFNVRLGLLEAPSPEQKQRARELLDEVGLPHRARQDFGTLSQGEKQLVLLARCLAQDAPVLLLDEPDSALDFGNRHRILARLGQTVRERGCAGLITLHDPALALTYCDRVLLLEDCTIADTVLPAAASREEVEEKLSRLYGPVRAFRQGGGWLVGSGSLTGETED